MISPRHSLLFVENDPEAIRAFAEAFTQLSEIYAVQVVASGPEAISYVKGIGKFSHRQEYPLPAVVVTGAGEEELAAIEWIRHQRQLECVRVVVLVDSEDEQIIRRVYEAGANSCLRKAQDFTELRDILALVGKYWMQCNQIPEAEEFSRA